MNKDDIQLLYEYDRWANNRVLQAVSALSAEQFTRDLAAAFVPCETRSCTSSAASAVGLRIGRSRPIAPPSWQI